MRNEIKTQKQHNEMMKLAKNNSKNIDDFLINQRRFGSKAGLGYTDKGESSQQAEHVINNQNQRPKVLTCYHYGKPGHTSNVCKSRAQGKPPAIPKFDGYCYYCGKYGHQAYECRAKQNANNTIVEKLCYTCNKHGHTAPECKEKMKQVWTPKQKTQ